MKYLASCLAILLVTGAAFAQTSPTLGSCVAVDNLTLPGNSGLGDSFTSPPYVALEPLGRLQRLAHRSRALQKVVALTDEQSACLEALTGARMTAVRAGATYSYKLQAPTQNVLIFHVADLVGGEALVSARGQRLLAKAYRLLQAGRSADAANIYQKVLQAGVPSWEVAVAQAALGKIEKDEGRLENALSHVSQAVEAYPRLASAQAEKAVLEEEVARLLAARREERRNSLIAQVAVLQGEDQQLEAIPLAQEALGLAEENFGPDSPEVAGHLDILATLYEAVGQDAEAEPLYRRVLAIREEALGTEHPETTESRNRLAALTQRISQSEEAQVRIEEVTVSSLPEETEAAEEESTAWLDPEPNKTPRASFYGGALVPDLSQLIEAASSEPEAAESDTTATTAQSSSPETLPAESPDALTPPAPDAEPPQENQLVEAASSEPEAAESDTATTAQSSPPETLPAESPETLTLLPPDVVPSSQENLGSTVIEPAVLPSESGEGIPKIEIQTEPAVLEGSRDIESITFTQTPYAPSKAGSPDEGGVVISTPGNEKEMEGIMPTDD